MTDERSSRMHDNVVVERQMVGVENQLKDAVKAEWGRLEKAYNAGFADGMDAAWDAAKKIYLPAERDGIPGEDLEEIFGTEDTHRIVSENTPEDAVYKIGIWEKKQELRCSWIEDDRGTIRCGQCNSMSPFNKRYYYCPNCGAMMIKVKRGDRHGPGCQN